MKLTSNMPAHPSRMERKARAKNLIMVRRQSEQRRRSVCLLALSVLLSISFSANSGTLVPHDAEWKYYKGRSSPPPIRQGIDWTARGYDDSTGWGGPKPGGFGYGDEYDTATLKDMQNQYSTLYIRHRFNVEDRSKMQSFPFHPA